MPGVIKGKPHLAHIKRDFHIVVHLKAKMLLGMDLIGPEMIDTNIKRRVAIIGSCQGLEVPLYIKPRQGGKIKRIVRAKAKVTIEPHTIRNVEVKVADLPRERDLTFTPDHSNATSEIRQKGAVYAHMVDSSMTFVQVRNDSDSPLVVQRHVRLGTVNDLEEEGCYAAAPEDHGFAGLDTFSKDKMGLKPSTTDPDYSTVL